MGWTEKHTEAVRGVGCEICETPGKADGAGAGLSVCLSTALLWSGEGSRANSFCGTEVDNGRR